MNPLIRRYHKLDKNKHGWDNTATITTLLLVITTILFIPMFIQIIQLNKIDPAQLPPELSLSSFSLLIGSSLLYPAMKLLNKDELKKLRRTVGLAVFAGFLFITLQGLSWGKIHLNSNNTGTGIIEVIIFVHGLNFIFGLSSLFAFFLKLCQLRNGLELFIYSFDTQKKSSLKAKCAYWNYMGGIWIIMYVILLIKAI